MEFIIKTADSSNNENSSNQKTPLLHLNDLFKELSAKGKSENEGLIVRKSRRLLSLEPLLRVFVWYFFSFLALFLSKHAIDSHSMDLLLFTGIQLVVSLSLSFLNKRFSSSLPSNDKHPFTHHFCFTMAFIGLTRTVVIYAGLLSMKWVALSFLETVKSSAPLFTLIISFFVLREKSGFLVQVSIVPIILGLFLCTAFEVSFNWMGFLAALVSNLAECLQFVLSKIYLGSSFNNIDPSDFQLYSSIAGLLTIFPLSPFLCDVASIIDKTRAITLLFALVVGVSYYIQTQMAWCLMEFLSPVTHSICNTIKCGLAVWLSILIFGNKVTLWSALGCILVLSGVCLYQKARSVEKKVKNLMVKQAASEEGKIVNSTEGSRISVDVDLLEEEVDNVKGRSIEDFNSEKVASNGN